MMRWEMIFGAALLAGCQVNGTTVKNDSRNVVSDPSPTVQFSQADNGRTVHVPRGAVIDVAVGDNRTLPYELRVLSLPSVLRRTGETYVAQQPVTVGSGGTTILRFAADAPGRGQLRIAHVGGDGRENNPIGIEIIVE